MLEIDGQFVPCDVTSDAEVARALAACTAEHGPARLAIACAGISPVRKLVARDDATGLPLPHETGLFLHTIDVNLVGTFRLFTLAGATMAMLPPLVGGERGLLIATADETTEGGKAARAAGAAGIVGMVASAARDFAELGIRCTAIAPERANAPIQAGLAAGFAALVAHIAENPMLNGTAIRLDGALRMPPR